MPVTRENLRIVLVENDPDDLFFLERALDKGGFSRPMIQFRDGMEAINYFNTLESPGAVLPDVVLTDLKMPRMDGTELLEWMRAQPWLKELPVIILSSSSEASDLRATTRLGIYKFITKQVSHESVIAALNQFVLALNLEAREATAGGR